MGEISRQHDRQAYKAFRLGHPAPERGVRRVLFLLGEDGSLLRALAKSAGEPVGWLRDQPVESAGALAVQAAIDESVMNQEQAAEIVAGETD